MSSSESTNALADGFFFIVGAPRSGTTLVQAILSSHPHVAIPPETEFFLFFSGEGDDSVGDGELIRYLTSHAWLDQQMDGSELERRFREQSDQTVRSLFVQMMEMQSEKYGKPRLGEKSPHHCRHVERIGRMFPNARFIHMVRDPRDVTASLMKMPWSRGSYLSSAREWRRLLTEHQRLLEEMDSSRYMGVRYESLVADTEAEVRRVCVFLDEPFKVDMLDFHQRQESGFDARESEWKGGTMRPVEGTSVQRFERDLSLRQIAGVQREVGPLLEVFDYEPCQTGRCVMWQILDWFDRFSDVVGRLVRSFRKRAG